MTYLDVVNKVLIRMREDTVNTVSESAYSSLIGEFVNDAYRQVEDAWNWSALRSTITVSTVDGIFSYILTDSGNRFTLIDVVNDTSNHFLKYQTSTWMNNAFLNEIPPRSAPFFYSFNGLDSNGDTQVDLYPIPDKQYDIRFNGILRKESLTNDTDSVTIPWLPIVHLAVALATRERGESGGQSVVELMVTADRMLSDAIALDAAKHPEETIYSVV